MHLSLNNRYLSHRSCESVSTIYCFCTEAIVVCVSEVALIACGVFFSALRISYHQRIQSTTVHIIINDSYRSSHYCYGIGLRPAFPFLLLQERPFSGSLDNAPGMYTDSMIPFVGKRSRRQKERLTEINTSFQSVHALRVTEFLVISGSQAPQGQCGWNG